MNSVVWEPVSTELSQHDFGHRIIDISDMRITFGTALQKSTDINYFGLSNVFSAIGGFLVSLKGMFLIVYAFIFGKVIKRQFAHLLYKKQKTAIDEENADDSDEHQGVKELKGKEWE